MSLAELKRRLGEEKVVDDVDILKIYARDPATFDYELPLAVVYAESAEDVAATPWRTSSSLRRCFTPQASPATPPRWTGGPSSCPQRG
ncbi:MAG: hypothetical protein ACPL3C_08915 [Pyrobaculum sp.]